MTEKNNEEYKMGDLSSHFSRREFTCKCGCGQDTVDANLIAVLERLRGVLKGAKITINSANRCERHNKAVGGRPHSFHLISKAADIVVQDVEPELVYNQINRMFPASLGLGKYKTFTHVDVREKNIRWSG